MQIEGPLLLIGCGKMGGALLQGWLDRGLPGNSVAVIDHALAHLTAFAERGVLTVESLEKLPADFSPGLVMFAIKPQMMDDAIDDYRRFVKPGTVFLSVVAGKKIAYFEEHLGAEAAVVRTMPNTPAAVSRGMTVLFANNNVSDVQKQNCEDLMAAAGETAWLDSEGQIDAVTGVSGSGPAYVFYMTECLAQAGIDAGLPRELAEKLARATVTGAGELMYRSEESPEQLRINVTSPKGTTQEGLEVLMAGDGLKPLISRTVAAAARRSRELS